MKRFLFYLLLIQITSPVKAQPLIHAHNDYQRPQPLVNALRNQVSSIEADVFPSKRGLVVAHVKANIGSALTLDSLYLQPIIRLFNQNQGRISENKEYSPVLMIDVKYDPDVVLPELIKLLAPYRSVFDRSINPMAVQIVISGDRGAISKWGLYPPYIFFDGRPYEEYDKATLLRIAFVSDTYSNYDIKEPETLHQMIDRVHAMGKLIRLWASPDNPASWKYQSELGIDIINTNKVEECRNFFLKKNN